MKRIVVSANYALALIEGENVVTLTEEEFREVIKTYNQTLTKEQLRKLEETRIQETGILTELELN